MKLVVGITGSTGSCNWCLNLWCRKNP